MNSQKPSPNPKVASAKRDLSPLPNAQHQSRMSLGNQTSKSSFAKYFEPVSESKAYGQSNVKSQMSQRQQSLLNGGSRQAHPQNRAYPYNYNMALRSTQKRSYSLGHHQQSQQSASKEKPAETKEIDLDKSSRRSILLESGKSSHSKSETNLNQKRISWGPSKVLEFFPNEHLRDREEISDKSLSANKSLTQFSPAHKKQLDDLNEMRDSFKPRTRVAGGILKNFQNYQNTSPTPAQKQQSSNKIQQEQEGVQDQETMSKRRYSHLTVVKEYEMPVKNSSVDQIQQSDDKSKEKQEDSLMEEVISLIKDEVKDQKQIKEEEKKMIQDINKQQDMVENDPTPRKSDQGVRQSIINKTVNQSRLSSNQPKTENQLFSKYFGQSSQKSKLEEPKQTLGDVEMADETGKKEEKNNVTGFMTEGINNNSTKIPDNESGGNEQQADLARESIFTKFNQSLYSIPSTEKKQELPKQLDPLPKEEPKEQIVQQDNKTQQNQQQTAKNEQPQLQTLAQLMNQMPQSNNGKSMQTRQSLLKQRQSIIQRPSIVQSKTAQSMIQQPKFPINYPTKLQVLQLVTQITDQKYSVELMQLINKHPEIDRVMDLICQVTYCQELLNLPNSKYSVRRHKLVVDLKQKLAKLRDVQIDVQGLIDSQKESTLQMQKDIEQALKTRSLQEQLSGISIDWDTTDHNCFTVEVHDLVKIEVVDYQSFPLKARMTITTDIDIETNARLLFNRLFQILLVQYKHYCLEDNDQLQQYDDQGVFDENGFIVIHSKLSDMIHYLEQNSLRNLRQIFPLLTSVHIMSVAQMVDDDENESDFTPETENIEINKIQSYKIGIDMMYIKEDLYYYAFQGFLDFYDGFDVRLQRQSFSFGNAGDMVSHIVTNNDMEGFKRHKEDFKPFLAKYGFV